DGFVAGYVIDQPASVRSVLEPILTAFGVDAFDEGNKLVFRSSARLSGEVRVIDEFVEAEEGGSVKRRLEEGMTQPKRIEIAYCDPLLDYQGAMAFAERSDGSGTETASLPAMIDPGMARLLAEECLQRRRASRRTATFELPWKHAGLSVGDRIRLEQA